MDKAPNTALHTMAEIIQGIQEHEAAMAAAREESWNHRMWRASQLEKRLQLAHRGSGWVLAPDEERLFGMKASAYIWRNDVMISGDFKFVTAKKMYLENIDVTIPQIMETCEPKYVYAK